jgi:glycosyltransferase involved in cell wall biosynthesis
MRVLISTRWVGGIGGVERSVASTIRALSDVHVDVCARQVIKSEFLVRPATGVIWPPIRWAQPSNDRTLRHLVWSPIHAALKPRVPPYDLYLHYFHGLDVRDGFSTRTSVLLPSGERAHHLETHFDLVALEAPGNASLIGDRTRTFLLPPPLEPMAQQSAEVHGLPPRYFLTVFNPHAHRKGADVLARLAPSFPAPIVWCHSRSTLDFETPRSDNVINLDSVSQESLRYLYEHCAAYISFSKNEGFGWAIADALLYGSPVVSRRVGILTFSDLDLSGVYTYSDESELVDLVRTIPTDRYERDLSQFSPTMFRSRIGQLLEGSS